MKAIAAKKQMHRRGLIPILFINVNITTENLLLSLTQMQMLVDVEAKCKRTSLVSVRILLVAEMGVL